MSSEFTKEEGWRLVKRMLQAMAEGLPPESDVTGEWTDKEAEARFKAAFEELAARDPRNIDTVAGAMEEIQQLRGEVLIRGAASISLAREPRRR